MKTPQVKVAKATVVKSHQDYGASEMSTPNNEETTNLEI